MKKKEIDEPAHWPLHIFLILMTMLTVYPILWVISIAFSGTQNLAIADLPSSPHFFDYLRAITPWPHTWSFSNFKSVMTDQPFSRWLLNSAVVAAATTVVGVFLSCTAAYAFSRFRFPGRRMGMMSFLVSQMFPGTLMLIPLYIILVQWLGLGSNRFGLVLVYATTAIPFCVWMMKGYFDTIPKDLEEAAIIDGASPAVVFWRIVLPLAKLGGRQHPHTGNEQVHVQGAFAAPHEALATALRPGANGARPRLRDSVNGTGQGGP